MIESIPEFVGMAYAIVATLAVVVLLRTGRFNRRIGYVFLGLSTVVGFLVFAPMLPYQFQIVLLGKGAQLGVPIALAIVVLVVFVVLSFAFGRAFCGYVCPIGAVQELLSHVPVRKLRLSSKRGPFAVRMVVLVAFLVLAVGFSVGILRYLGIREFFHLEASSAFFYVFLGLTVTSAFFYRPFCRFLCPYGALLSIAAGRSRFKLRRTEECNECGKCERVCPTNEAGDADSKQECYLCNRCKEACPTGGIRYSLRVRPPGEATPVMSGDGQRE
jgi:polyferredoxin